MRKKSKSTSCSLKNNGALLFNPLKMAETFNFFFTNIGPNMAKRAPQGKKSPMAYLKNKFLNLHYFYPVTPNKVIKIIKCFSNNKSSGPSLPIAYQDLY